jgi:hypothetical protein
MQQISLPGSFKIAAGKTTDIFIQADVNAMWHSPNDVRITNLPVCTTPGAIAKKISDNCAHLFSIKKIIVP